METDTRVLIHHGFSPSPLRNEVLLGVVTVQLGPAEDDGLVHLVFIDGPHQVFNLQDLHRLRESFWKQKQFSHFHTFSILTFRVYTCMKTKHTSTHYSSDSDHLIHDGFTLEGRKLRDTN